MENIPQRKHPMASNYIAGNIELSLHGRPCICHIAPPMKGNHFMTPPILHSEVKPSLVCFIHWVSLRWKCFNWSHRTKKTLSPASYGAGQVDLIPFAPLISDVKLKKLLFHPGLIRFLLWILNNEYTWPCFYIVQLYPNTLQLEGGKDDLSQTIRLILLKWIHSFVWWILIRAW